MKKRISEAKCNAYSDRYKNKAIYSVLNHKYKRECPEDHELVTKLGYEIEKYNGSYNVRNPKTKRSLCIVIGKYKYLNRKTTVQNNIIIDENNIKFDFIGYLNKPFNDQWYEMKCKNNYWTELKIKQERLTQYKNRVKWSKKDIETVKENISKMQDRLEDRIRHLVECEYELNELRKEYGLEGKKQQ